MKKELLIERINNFLIEDFEIDSSIVKPNAKIIDELHIDSLDFVDIVVFGKKSQVSGIMVREQFGEIFKNALRLEVTWDGDLLDMIRCRWILQAFQKFNILENVISRGKQLGTALREIASVENVRQVGLLIAFDFKDTGVRDEYVRSMRHHKTIVLPTQEKSIRWRPNLAMTDAEAKLAISRSAKCYS